jgi:hypothetical protein
MQNQNENQHAFAWHPAPKFLEFAFEEPGHKPTAKDGDEKDEDEEDMESGSRSHAKGKSSSESSDSNTEEPSNEIIDFQKAGSENQLIEIATTGPLVLDELAQVFVFVSQGSLPALALTLNPEGGSAAEGQPEKRRYVKLLLAEKTLGI